VTSSPSKTRWVILGLLFLISVITYVDRINISVAAKDMMPAMGLTPIEMGNVFSVFVLGYALFQIPGGWLGDRFGPRLILTLAVIWWSVFTILTAWAASLPTATVFGTVGSLMLIRFLIGIGEAAALPNFARTIANWFGPDERGFGMGISIGGIGVGAAITPPLTAWLMLTYNWQTPFYIAGIAGIFIGIIWYMLATDHPEQHPRVNQEELTIIKKRAYSNTAKLHTIPLIPWRAFALNRSVWLITISYTCLGYVAYVYLSWFYLYLINVRGFDVLKGAFYASGPFIAIAILCPLGGWASDRCCQVWGITIGRSMIGCFGMASAATLITIGIQISQSHMAILFLSLGAGCLYFSVGSFWASTIDLSKNHSGTLSGIMNTGANLGGTLSPTLTPWLADKFGWAASLQVAAVIAFIGAMLWIFVKAGEQIEESD
tara:strand:+ start:1636 stop:2931 length:1296 start_codon:yes stop_codon:yes gene_type:complete